MSLVINHNMMAANTARNLNSHYSQLSKSTQRLSTGLRVNSAADDAAGLAIRELRARTLPPCTRARATPTTPFR